MTVVPGTSIEAPAVESAPQATAEVRLALFGVGQVGSAVARLAPALRHDQHGPFRITAGLVRDPDSRHRPADVPLTSNPAVIFDSDPTVVIEALGGVEPARSLVLEALGRGLPVVTANKSLVARHGDELFEAASIARVGLRYEATVIAGVPFLGTFARRRFAAKFITIAGIVNGTTNFILSQLGHEGSSYATALAEAQRRGFAEPDPAMDVDGIDAAEKLAVLARLDSVRNGRKTIMPQVEPLRCVHRSRDRAR